MIGPLLRVAVEELKPPPDLRETPLTTLNDAEREHILTALKQTNWVIGGASGAAARLGMKRTTLISRMQKLGIERAKRFTE